MATLRQEAGERGLRNGPRAAWCALICLVAVAVASQARGQGIYLPSVGPINQSMSGAAVAAPIDAIGALNWNPASIAALPASEIAFGLGLVLPTTSVSSQLGPYSGSTDSEPGVCPVPTIGFVHRQCDSRWTLGLGIFGVGGFSANYPASLTNPILSPPPSAAVPIGGLGQVFARAEIYQIVPTFAYAVSDRLSIGIAPTMTLARLEADPLVFAPPNDANGDGFYTYGPGTGSRMGWGGGFQAGVYYTTDACWNFGLSYKSQQWMEPFRFHSHDEVGGPLFAKVNFTLPAITSLGIAYTGFDRWLLATDFRYFDFANATGFAEQGFRPDGSVAGLGWNSVFSVSQGVQYQFSDRLVVRTGYTYNENPIPSQQAMFNVASSLIIQHWYSVGATYHWNPRVYLTLAYTHGFRNEVTGPFQTPLGPVPGTSVTERVSADIVNAGVTVTF